MARSSLDVSDIGEIQLRDVVFPMKNPRIKPGYRVYIKGNFKADFHTGDDKDVKSGKAWNGDGEEMTLNGDIYEITIPNLEVGQTYHFVY